MWNSRFLLISVFLCAIFCLGACSEVETNNESQDVKTISINSFSLLNKKYRIYGYLEKIDANTEVLKPFYATDIKYKLYNDSTLITDNNSLIFNYNYKSGDELEYIEFEVNSELVNGIELYLSDNSSHSYKLMIGCSNSNKLISFVEIKKNEIWYLDIKQI